MKTITGPRTRVASPQPAAELPTREHALRRLRLIVICVGLTFVVFSQSSGRTAPDTKLDLVVSPLRFLRRALTLWDPLQSAGQLQNQAYGYLFPMGPFFALGKLSALPPWVIQRGWQSALVIAAFLGVVRLSRLLGVEAFWASAGAGLAYALSPRMLSELGSISAELTPMAALPWMVIPLVSGSRHGSPRRAAAWSGIAVLFAGGVNAAATVAVLPVPALWLLTRRRGRRRSALLRWWCGCVALASAWWVIPLLLLGRFSPPFLDWIESSRITTSVTTLVATVRGADHWEAYLGPGVWPAGWILVAAPAAVLASALVSAGGLAGLARRGTAERGFLIGCLLVGLVLVTAGYVGTAGPPFGPVFRPLLDGPLNALRNIHKFDPVLRLPLAIGLGYQIAAVRVPARATLRWRRSAAELRVRPLAVIVAAGIAATAGSPAVAGRLMPAPRVTTEASWWTAAGSWLGAHAGAGRTLVVPGASRPVYLWGSPVDDALQPAADAPWGVRDGVPLAQAGYIRLLDDAGARLAAGARDDALVPLLARAGIRYLLVRNDLDAAASVTTDLALVHATIDATPGLPREASLGPVVGAADDQRRLVDLGLGRGRPAIEIYAVGGWAGPVQLAPVDQAVIATGAADDLGALLDNGLDPARPVLFGTDGADLHLPHPTTVLTDGIRRQEASFAVTGRRSATMTADQPFTQQRPVHDYLPSGTGALAVMAYGGGIRDVRASSSAADVDALANSGHGAGPWSAIDGDPSTAWESGVLGGPDGQWLEVNFRSAVDVPSIEVSFAPGLAYPTRLRISTDTAARDTDVAPAPYLQTVRVPPGPTTRMRITVLASTGGPSVGIATLRVPGVASSRSLVVPEPARPDVLAFTVASGGRPGCLHREGRAVCDPSFAARGEEDGLLARTFTLSGPAVYRVTARLAARPGPALDALLDAGASARATASSVDSPDPGERAGAAVDGDPLTTWVAGVGDLQPWLHLDLGAPRRVGSVTLAVDPRAAVAVPQVVQVSAGGRSWQLSRPESGVVRLPRSVVTGSVDITVVSASLRSTTSSVTGQTRLLPAGISEVGINGRPFAAAAPMLRLGCSSGLAMTLDGRTIPLQATVSRDDVLQGRPFSATTCDEPATGLTAGVHDVSLPAGLLADPRSVEFERPGASFTPAPVANGGAATPVVWTATRRVLRVSAPSESLLVVHENANAGWQATLHGRPLTPVRVDGWQQGWVVPACASGTIVLDYRPQRLFTAGLIGGALCITVLIGLCLAAARPGPTEAEAAGPRRYRAGTPWAVAALAAVVLCGWFGVLALGAVLLAVWVGARRGIGLSPLAGAAAFAVAGLLEAVRPAGSAAPLASSALVQSLAVAAVVLTVVGSRPARGAGREKRRSAGRSRKYQDSVPSSVEEAAVSRNSSQ